MCNPSILLPSRRINFYLIYFDKFISNFMFSIKCSLGVEGAFKSNAYCLCAYDLATFANFLSINAVLVSYCTTLSRVSKKLRCLTSDSEVYKVESLTLPFINGFQRITGIAINVENVFIFFFASGTSRL